MFQLRILYLPHHHQSFHFGYPNTSRNSALPDIIYRTLFEGFSKVEALLGWYPDSEFPGMIPPSISINHLNDTCPISLHDLSHTLLIYISLSFSRRHDWPLHLTCWLYVSLGGFCVTLNIQCICWNLACNWGWHCCVGESEHGVMRARFFVLEDVLKGILVGWVLMI